MTFDVLALELLPAEFARDRPICGFTCMLTICEGSKILN